MLCMDVRDEQSQWSHLEFDLCDRLRKSLRVGQVGVNQMAGVLDVDRNTVSNYLGGRRKPSRSTLAMWAMATGVPFAWLETGEIDASGGGDVAAEVREEAQAGGGRYYLPRPPGDTRYAVRDSNPEPADMYSAPALFLLSDPNKVAA